MSYTLYILRCSDDTYYTGITNNIEKRLKAHNSLKSGAKYTKMRRPVTLVYTESLASLSAALQREFEVKQLSRDDKEKLWQR